MRKGCLLWILRKGLSSYTSPSTYVGCGGLVVSKHGLYMGSLGLIPTAIVTGTGTGGDAEHVSLITDFLHHTKV